jgi:hypothetical protein
MPPARPRRVSGQSVVTQRISMDSRILAPRIGEQLVGGDA